MKKAIIRKSGKKIEVDDSIGRIQEIIHDQKLSIKEFCRTTGLVTSTITNQLSRGTLLSLTSYRKIIDAYPEYSVEWLVTGREPKFTADRDNCRKQQEIFNPHGVYILSGSPTNMPALPYADGDSQEAKGVPLFSNVVALIRSGMQPLGTLGVDFAAEGDVAAVVGVNDMVPHCEQGDVVVLRERRTSVAPIVGRNYLMLTADDVLAGCLTRCDAEAFALRIGNDAEITVPVAEVTHIYNIVGKISPLRAMVY